MTSNLKGDTKEVEVLTPDRIIQFAIGPAAQRSLPGKYVYRVFPSSEAARCLSPKPNLPRVDRWSPLLDTLATLGTSQPKQVFAVTLGMDGKRIQLWVSSNGGPPGDSVVRFYKTLWVLLKRWRDAVAVAQQARAPRDNSPDPGDSPAVSTCALQALWLVVRHGWEKWQKEMTARMGEFKTFYEAFERSYTLSGTGLTNTNPSGGGSISQEDKDILEDEARERMEDARNPSPKEKAPTEEAIAAMIQFRGALFNIIEFFGDKTNRTAPVDKVPELAKRLHSLMVTLYREGRAFHKGEYVEVLAGWFRKLKITPDLRFAVRRCIQKKTNLGEHFSVLETLVRSTQMNTFMTASGENTEFNVDLIQEPQLPDLKPTRENVEETLNAISDSGDPIKKKEVIDRAMEGVPETIRLHAELAQVSFHFNRVKSNYKDGKPAPFPYIGISKLCCYACHRFLATFNELVKKKRINCCPFGFRGSHGKAYRSWTMPKNLPPELLSVLEPALLECFVDDYKDSRQGHVIAHSDSSAQSGHASGLTDRSSPIHDSWWGALQSDEDL